jgi:hypothetical protein
VTGWFWFVLCLLTFTFRLFDSRINAYSRICSTFFKRQKAYARQIILTGYSSPVYFMTWAKSWSVFRLQQTTFAKRKHILTTTYTVPLGHQRRRARRLLSQRQTMGSRRRHICSRMPYPIRGRGISRIQRT